jgi:thiol-disulfide isomerase/thioredoxin
MKHNIKIKSIIFSVLMIIALSSCDQIKPPYEQTNNQPIDPTTKNVLLEEYTGFRCGNCPAAAEESHRIKAKYGNKVVVLAIHVGQLAMPVPQHKYDFRTSIGNTLDEFYKIGSVLGTPNGLIDRSPYNSNPVLDYHTWEAAVIARTNEKAKMTLYFLNSD